MPILSEPLMIVATLTILVAAQGMMIRRGRDAKGSRVQ
jgi:hypothetical protein